MRSGAAAWEMLSQLELLRHPRQVPRAAGRDERHVLDADAAQAEVVQPGLDRDHVAGAERGRPGRDRRRLVDLQAEAVPGAVEEALHAPVLHPRPVAARYEQRVDLPVDRRPVGPGTNATVAEPHALLHQRVHLLEALARTAPHDRARQVAEVAGALRAREDVHHHWLMAPYRPVAFLVRIHGLVPGRADRVGGDAAAGQDGGVDRGAQVLGGEPAAVTAEVAVPADAAGAQRREPGLQARLGRPEGLDDGPYFVGPLPLPPRPERVGRGAYDDAAAFQLAGETDREAARHFDAANPEVAQHFPYDRRRRRPSLCSLDPLRNRRPRQDTPHTGLPARAVALEVAHDHQPPASGLHEEERVGRKETGRIEGVGVRLGGGVDEAGPAQRTAVWRGVSIATSTSPAATAPTSKPVAHRLSGPRKRATARQANVASRGRR